MEHRRVGIVTINDDTNYGNRLQSFALQEVVRSLGWEPEVLRNRPPAWDRSLMVPRMMHDIRHDPSGVAQRVVGRLRQRAGRRATLPPAFLELRRSAISAFARTHIAVSPHRYSEMPAEFWASRYARGIAGSDQVWNPEFRRAQSLDFLEFLDATRRISYAASFGVEQVPGYLRSRYRTWLRGIPHLSVRESSGRRIVSELTGRDAAVVLDPTLLADMSVWDDLIAAQPPIVEEPYAVRFFLGRPAPEQDAWVRRHAERASLALVDLHALDEPAFAEVDPGGFVAAIARAEVVYTDSFHAGVFALRYRRPIIVRSRFDRDARWMELLAQHGLVAQGTGVGGLGSITDVDWQAVEARRGTHRQASMAFLRAALDG